MHTLRQPSLGSLLLALTCAAPLACTESAEQHNNIAKAFEQSDPKAAAKQASEDMKRLKERTAAKAEAAIREAIDAVTIVPDAPPSGDLKATCQAMRDAYDGFVERRIAGDPAELERWSVFKPMDLDKAEDECIDRKNIQVARCQAHAFANASREIARGRANAILARCVDKFGNKLGATQPQGPRDQPS